MRHRKAGIKLNRTSSHRKAMFRNMVTSLIKYDQIRTTDAKAKELRRWGDKLVTLAKRGDLHARRQALSIVCEREVVKKLFDEAPERFKNVSGGYTRVIKIGRRPGDAATMSLVSFADPKDSAPKKKKKKKSKSAAATPVKSDTPSSHVKDGDDLKGSAAEKGDNRLSDSEIESEAKPLAGETDETLSEDGPQVELETDDSEKEAISPEENQVTEDGHSTNPATEEKSS